MKINIYLRAEQDCFSGRISANSQRFLASKTWTFLLGFDLRGLGMEILWESFHLVGYKDRCSSQNSGTKDRHLLFWTNTDAPL